MPSINLILLGMLSKLIPFRRIGESLSIVPCEKLRVLCVHGCTGAPLCHSLLNWKILSGCPMKGRVSLGGIITMHTANKPCKTARA